MNHFEKVLVNEIIINVTPMDMDGEILYKIIYNHKDYKTMLIDDIKIFKLSKCQTNIVLKEIINNDDTLYKEITDNKEKKKILFSLAYHNNDDNDDYFNIFERTDNKKQLERGKPIFDSLLGCLSIKIVNKGIMETIERSF